MREPIPEIFLAAHFLDRAVGAHLSGDRASAAELINAADMPIVREWTESLWGKRMPQYLRFRTVPGSPPKLAKADRIKRIMPNLAQERLLVDRYGRNCVFCGIPLIHMRVREAVKKNYPHIKVWGDTNPSQHAAFQCMWMQFDHILPHARGGDNSSENFFITCAPCNYARVDQTLEEAGLLDPRCRSTFKTSWDGLERFLTDPS